jgi:hypothetical protein
LKCRADKTRNHGAQVLRRSDDAVSGEKEYEPSVKIEQRRFRRKKNEWNQGATIKGNATAHQQKGSHGRAMGLVWAIGCKISLIEIGNEM